MENLILSFNVVLPLFLNIALGYALRCLHMIDETTQMLPFVLFSPFRSKACLAYCRAVRRSAPIL